LGRVIASKTRPTKIAADGHWSLQNRGQFVIDNFRIPKHFNEPPLRRLLRRTRENLDRLIARRLLRFFHTFSRLAFLFRRLERGKHAPLGDFKSTRLERGKPRSDRRSVTKHLVHHQGTPGNIFQDGCRHVMAVQLGLGEEGDQNSNSGLGMTSCAALGASVMDC
jgi:hypothetical protein